jgi:exopolysaccharide biosynthesis WecB/TagA/CpsF family protein
MSVPSLTLGGVRVMRLSENEALRWLHRPFTGEDSAPRHCLKLAFANAHVVNLAASRADFSAALAAMAVLPDGIGVDIGARLVHGVPFPANLNGTDFIPKLILAAPRPLKVALLGARSGVAERAAKTLAGLDPRHTVIALGHGYFDTAEENRILARLEAEPVDLLLVAFGNPRQELWITQRIGPRHARMAAGVGALLDFLAGEVPRAPAWLIALRLEWIYRLAREPARLWRRYILGNPAFIARMVSQRWQAHPRAGH